MENPATWGKLELVIDQALRESDMTADFGLSLVRRVADKLRAEGLICEEVKDEDTT